MALQTYTTTDLDSWIDKLKEVIRELGTIKGLLEENKMESVLLEATRADDNISYVTNWGYKATAKAREEVAKHKTSLLKARHSSGQGQAS